MDSARFLSPALSSIRQRKGGALFDCLNPERIVF